MSDLLSSAETAAASKPASAPASSNYREISGPVEVEGAHGDAFVVESPTGIRYVEYRPRGGGRVKRVQVIAATAIARSQGWRPPAAPRKKRAASKPSK